MLNILLWIFDAQTENVKMLIEFDNKSEGKTIL